MKTLIIHFAALLILFAVLPVEGRGADKDPKGANAAAALEKTKFVDYPQDAPERPKGYFLTATNADHTLGVLMPTAETDGDVHNYIVDIANNKIIGEVDHATDDDLDFFGHSHGGIDAEWKLASDDGRRILCVITYHGKWGERALRVLEINDRGADAKGARYNIGRQVDIWPLVVGKLTAAMRRKDKKTEAWHEAAGSYLIDQQGRLLIEATGMDNPKGEAGGGGIFHVVSIVARYDTKTRKLTVLDTSPVTSGGSAND